MRRPERYKLYVVMALLFLMAAASAGISVYLANQTYQEQEETHGDG